MDHWRNQKVPGDKWKSKHNDPKSTGCSKSSSKGLEEFTVIQAYLRKQEKSHINNLTLYLKELEMKNKQNTKLVEGKKS